MKPAVFLDRDGTLIEDAHFLADPGAVRLEPGVEALSRLKQAGFLLVVCTNQSGVARGYFDEATVHAVNDRIADLLEPLGARPDAFYHCPHHPQGTVPGYARACDCRKPAPGMILTAARDLGIDLSRSYLVGDAGRDIEAARRAGVTGILLGRGRACTAGTREVADLREAVDCILEGQGVHG